MIKPLSKNVLLRALPLPEKTSGGIITPAKYETENWEYTILACGSKVPFDYKPSMRVLLKPGYATQRPIEHDGESFLVVPFGELLMAVGVEQ